MNRKYWINVVSADHVQRGVAGGFTQANHGKANGLKRLHADDWILFYSSKTAYVDGRTLQAFTAIGEVADDTLYQVTVSPDFTPWRRKVMFHACRQTPIRPLLDQLNFIQDKTHWGYMFRLGLFEIPEADFTLIHKHMTA